MTKTDLTLYTILFSLLLLYIILCCTSIVNLSTGSLYSQATTPDTRDTNLAYQNPKPLNILEEIANTFNIPVRTLILTITILLSLLWGILIYTSTANTAIALVTMVMIFFISKIFLGV